MNKVFKTLIVVLPVFLLIIFATPTYAHRTDDSTHMEAHELEKQQMMEEREQHREELKLQKETKLMELKAQREAKKTELQAFRCEKLSQVLSQRAEKVQSGLGHTEKLMTRWTTILDKLEEKGYSDLPEYVQLEADLQTLFSMMEELKTLKKDFATAIMDSRVKVCDETTNSEETASLEESQNVKDELLAHRDQVKALTDEIKAYYQDVIKPDLQALRLAISELKADTRPVNSEVQEEL